MESIADIVVVGGGLVGLSASVALSQAGYQVTLVDMNNKKPIDDSFDAWDSRIYALSMGNVNWLKDLGVWENLDVKRIAPIRNMQIWSSPELPPLSFDPQEIDHDDLGFIIESSNLEDALTRSVSQLGITIRQNHVKMILNDYQQAKVVFDSDDEIICKLIVGADGGQSSVRNFMEASQSAVHYEQFGVVANFLVEKPHSGIARQWFLDEGILAWLPLPDNRISIVFSTKQYESCLAMQEEEFSEYIASLGGNLLGKMTLISPVAAYPLIKNRAKTVIRERIALIGDAAHQVHPMMGQGVNLGFRDVITLIETLSKKGRRETIGDYLVLRRYERARLSDVLAIQWVTHGLYGLFDQDKPWVKTLRDKIFDTPNRLPLVRKILMKQALV
jgi:2-polyprenylphenol 6-hydroxylase